MSQTTVAAVARWQNAASDDDELDITFHGGEPLAAGAAFYRMALPLLRQELAPRRVSFAIQSNLWLLNEELCDLFVEYGVAVGTSLDGPEAINDRQRGRSYFKRSMAGIELARQHGLEVGCICTFTAQSLPQAGEIFDFFVSEGLDFNLHAAVPALGQPPANPWALDPSQHGQLLVDMLDRYLAKADKIRIHTLDALCRSVSTGQGGICTFGDCLGNYLAVGPEGEIYPCQRFGGRQEYRLGNVHTCPAPVELAAAPAWQKLAERQKRADEACKHCTHFAYCRGGCPYNALAASEGARAGESPSNGWRDPHCPAYRRAFSQIIERAMQEVFSAENMAAVVQQADPHKGLLRKGRLLSILRGGPHPQAVAQHARLVLAAVLLATTGSPTETAAKLQQLGLTTNLGRAQRAMQLYQEQLTTPSQRLNNLYLHVTFACNLRCTHCYAQAGPPRKGYLSVEDTRRAGREAAELGFRHVVITGGEPLVHPQRDPLLDELAQLHQENPGLLSVLRTNLAVPLDDDLLGRLGRSTDQVVVSVDGDRETHDARRGAGTYDLTVSNLRRLVEMGLTTDLSLAAVLPLEQANGAPGNAVRALAEELGLRRIRFRPLLPLGRAAEAEIDLLPETMWGHIDPREMMEYGFNPVASCGIGQNLYVEPDGAAYPCYAWHAEGWELGNINAEAGLAGILAAPAFQDLRQHTVDSNRGCKSCALRYLCGGACRAWNFRPGQAQTDLDAAPRDCTPLYRRASSLLTSALERLEISPAQWQAAGLPWPGESKKDFRQVFWPS